MRRFIQRGLVLKVICKAYLIIHYKIRFSKSIEAYRRQANKAYRDEQIEEIVNDFLKGKEREIDVLVTAHYYEEAISWYKALKALKDYSEEIEEIQSIFDISGETINISSDLKSIEVQNPIGEEQPSVSTYQYDGESYREQKQEVLEVSLGDETLQTRIGEVIQFECYYPETLQDETVTVYNFEGQTYFFDQGAYLNLQEDIILTEGKYRIIGEIVGVSTYYDDILQTEVTMPIIEVLQVEQR